MDYQVIEGVPGADELERLAALYHEVFGDERDLAAQLRREHAPLVLLARDGDELVGFKLGFEERPGRFYSWLGGVALAHRRRGIASELMRRQHDLCRQRGYLVVRTHTQNRWREMLILDLRHGFDVVGTFVPNNPTREDESGEELRIVLEKRLQDGESSWGACTQPTLAP